MGNSFAETYHHLLQEDIEFLLQRSEEHERQLAEVSNEWQQLVSTIRQRDEHIAELYSDGNRLAEAVQQQADQITHLDSIANRLAKAVQQQDEQIKTLNTAVDKVTMAVLAITNKPLSVAARLGHVLYWLCAGAAVISLSLGGIRLYSGLKSHNLSRPDDWLFPVVLCVLGVSAWLTGRALRYVLAGR